MKFGKRLNQQIQETLPEWRDKFLCYKELKKLVRLISSSTPGNLLNGGSPVYGKPESEFVFLLNNQIDKFNTFFMEKEEDFIIRHKELQQRIHRVQNIWGPNGSHASESYYKEEIGMIRKDIVNFHGEMVLLINYSNINYTGLAKILKKYDKRTGSLLRLPFIQKVLEQPFFTTDLISKLIKELETTIDAMFPAGDASYHEDEQLLEESRKKIRENNYEIVIMGEGIFRNTVAALLTVQQIRTGSSTYSQFSLPPVNLSDSELILQSTQ
ncbi:SPX domain-containing protein 3 [Bienertia sinuspersici]